MKKKYIKPKVHCMDFQNGIKYQVNHNYILREIVGEYILVPTGKELANFNGLVTMNRTGVFLWKFLQEQRSIEEIVECFQKEFQLTREESWNDVSEFLDPAVTRNVILKC